jgi:acyl-CoA reductase-like NAD-dependent aldehyde dehydrogenase
LTSSPVDKIIFTGSTEKGRLVAAAAAKNLVPCILELGGKSPMIVDKSANLEYAA